jgi:hypothetical protein
VAMRPTPRMNPKSRMRIVVLLPCRERGIS